MPATEEHDKGNSRSGIFEGTKFWLSHRIPDRANVIALIKGHGGLVEAYDKRADILIADHARRDAPPNSFSWRLITESDKAGRFLDKETHRIGRPPTGPRPVASQTPTKARRTPFSAADDALLASWVSRSEQKSGNKIYQELEASHPHHTWHSWRDRWLKHVRLLPPDVLDRMVNSGDSTGQSPVAPAPNGHTATNRPKQGGRRTPPKTQQPPSVQPGQASRPSPPQALHPSSPQALRASSPQASRTLSLTALRFSSTQALRPSSPRERQESPDFNDEDDSLLEQYVKYMVEGGQRWNDNAIYKKLAKEYPRHSVESWKRRFAQLWRDRRIDMKNWNSTDRSRTNRPNSRPPTNSEGRLRGGNVSRKRDSTLSDQDAISSPEKSTPGTSTPKELFYRRYRVWIELKAEEGQTREVTVWHYIQGRKITIWRLYEAVLGQESPVDEVDWKRVAQSVGFREPALVHASEELEGCWDKYLSEFHQDSAAFKLTGFAVDDSGESTEGTDDSSAEENASEEEAIAEEEGMAGEKDIAEEEGIPGDDVLESQDVSTPRRTGISPSSSRLHTGASHRKRRLDRGAEIPASPSPKLKPGPAHGVSNTTPSKRRRLTSRAKERRPEPESDGDENATPTREPLMRTGANHSSPLSVRPPARGESGTPASNAVREQPGGGNGTSNSTSTRVHNRRSTATPGSSTAGMHVRNTIEASTQTPSPLQAPKRRALPLTTAPEPEPEPGVLVDDNSEGGDESEDQDDNRDEVQTTVEQFVQEGYSREMAVEGLYRTSMVPALSRKVLASLARGDGVPKNQAGIWTPRDDAKLRTIEAGNLDRPTENIMEHKRKQELMKSLEALVRKHGKNDVEARKRFLADAKQVGFSL